MPTIYITNEFRDKHIGRAESSPLYTALQQRRRGGIATMALQSIGVLNPTKM